ncbi:MAG: efflux RND transporter periplasmic adaptor subunit [Flavobacterium sp.]|nr:efflux RND transporter periplasmic adaptor subunit [Flavobacterium sp.]
MKKYILISKILVILVLFSCEKEQTKAVEETKKGNTIKLSKSILSNLKISKVEEVNAEEALTVVGEITFDEDNIVRVFPIVSGNVDRVNVSLGDYVKRGQVLAEITSTDINQFQVDYKVAKSTFTVAENNYKRVKELHKTNFASDKELAEAESDYFNKKSEYEGKKKLLKLYGAKENTNDSKFYVTAPNNGYIVERTINEGTQIRTDNNQNMFIISDLKSVWVWANVHESEISKVNVGDKVSVTTISYPDKNYIGEIKKIGSVLEEDSRVVKVRIDLENPNEKLKPKMFATVAISPKSSSKFIGVPKAAVFIEQGKNWIVKEVANNTFQKFEVITGKGKNSTHVEILEGVEVGDVIISEGALAVATSINNQ